MESWIPIVIFVTIVIIYLHVIWQYKHSEDLEIYEMDYVSNKGLQEVCNIKQPVLFNMQNWEPRFYNAVSYTVLNKLTQDINLKDNNDYFSARPETTIDYVTLPLQGILRLMKTDNKACYFSENNAEFIEESGLVSEYRLMDKCFKPLFSANTTYDLLIGSRNVCTPLRYHNQSHRFCSITTGKVRVKMTPWRSRKYLDIIRDYDNYDFFTNMNVWYPLPEHKHVYNQMRFLEFDIDAGNVLFIPPYWFYSIRFAGNEDTVGAMFSYSTIPNVISNIYDIGMYYYKHEVENKQSVNTNNIQNNILQNLEDENLKKETASSSDPGPKKNSEPINEPGDVSKIMGNEPPVLGDRPSERITGKSVLDIDLD
jgi:hypothetical protein